MPEKRWHAGSRSVARDHPGGEILVKKFLVSL